MIRADVRARPAALAAALALALVAGAAAETGDADRAFVTAFVAAINGGTAAARAALVHPKARGCLSGEPGEYWSEVVARQAKSPVPAEHRWKITPVPAGQAPVFDDHFDYPITPTHILQLDIKDAPFSLRVMLVQLAKDGERWAEVVPCAKAKTVIAIRAAQAAKAKRAERVKTLVADMKPEQRERLLALIKGGQRIDASKTYAQESGEDLTTAVDVVELLAEKTR